MYRQLDQRISEKEVGPFVPSFGCGYFLYLSVFLKMNIFCIYQCFPNFENATYLTYIYTRGQVLDLRTEFISTLTVAYSSLTFYQKGHFRWVHGVFICFLIMPVFCSRTRDNR